MRTPALTRCHAVLVAATVVLSLGSAPAYASAPAPAMPRVQTADRATDRAEAEATSPSDRATYAVRAQRQLRRLQCAPGPMQADLGERARAAVTRFQSASGMRQSGRFDPATRRALRAPGAADCLDRPVPARSGQGRRIVVSQSQNFLWMVGRDGNAFHRAPVVDNPDVLSPGTWRTGSYCGRSERIWRNQDLTYTEWLYGFVRFAPCGIGFHRIPIWQDTGRQIHPDWWLGTDKDASQGCIRLDRRTMQRVWDFTGRATTTVVVLP